MAMTDEHRLSSRRTAEIISRELANGDLDFAFRIMVTAIDDFRHASPSNHEDFLIAPGSTGSLRWDTLLAAVIGRECDRLGIPKPPWTQPKPLEDEWVVTVLPNATERWLARIKSGTPVEFSRLGLWIHARDLESR
ncbi:hypothetical protein [Arthrobacter sp. efr-133-TYG-120]|uniref:hypothetical protein n=1 Tax=Arthrobacter sp. efr-133-TYG-120 TaxID=3040280 RepID=UPI00254B9852|nr:hypothetical protein [Arthrobacter sp. efr-133-TYG-120]